MKTLSPLTFSLKTIETDLEEISSSIVDLFERAHNEEQVIIANALRAGNALPENQNEATKEIHELLENSVYRNLDEAKVLTDRFLAVTRKIQTISKRLETWERIKSDIKKLIFESEWFKKRYPAEYERRRRLRETPWTRETFRHLIHEQDPDIWQNIYRKQRPRNMFEGRSVKKMTRIAEVEKIQEDLNEVIQQVYDLMKRFFYTESPIVKASNDLRKYLIHLRRPGLLDRLERVPGIGALLKLVSSTKERREALGDIIRILESIFGYEGRPGQYIATGEKAFLAPVIAELKEAYMGLDRLTEGRLGEPQAILERLEEIEGEKKAYFRQRQQRRGIMLQRLMALVSKEEFNG